MEDLAGKNLSCPTKDLELRYTQSGAAQPDVGVD